MIREQTLRARQKVIGKLPITGELLRSAVTTSSSIKIGAH
jgi:hypothetical protein